MGRNKLILSAQLSDSHRLELACASSYGCDAQAARDDYSFGFTAESSESCANIAAISIHETSPSDASYEDVQPTAARLFSR